MFPDDLRTLDPRALTLLAAVTHGRLSVNMGALPFVAPVRHLVSGDDVLLRTHRGFGYHRACDGSVVAYGADNVDECGESVWTVQLIGTARVVEPSPDELERLGTPPRLADNSPFVPAYLRFAPRLAIVHTLDGVCVRCGEHPA